YNRRAVRLHAIARYCVEHLDRHLPRSPAELRELEGLGAYTANAVACFAFEQDTPVVDTNVRRVLGRVFADVVGLDPPAGPRLIAFAEHVVPTGQGYAWNQALMDLGATVCTARNPKHDICPLTLQCAGRELVGNGVARAAERPVEYRVSQPFEQTTRYFRGRIVARLRELPHGETLPVGDLGPILRDDFADEHVAWLAELVEGLRRDGLVAVHATDDGIRVSLP